MWRFLISNVSLQKRWGLNCTTIIRLHRMHEMQTIVTDLCGVCLSVCHVSPVRIFSRSGQIRDLWGLPRWLPLWSTGEAPVRVWARDKPPRSWRQVSKMMHKYFVYWDFSKHLLKDKTFTKRKSTFCSWSFSMITVLPSCPCLRAPVSTRQL